MEIVDARVPKSIFSGAERAKKALSQLKNVRRVVWELDAAGSSPVTLTKGLLKSLDFGGFFFAFCGTNATQYSHHIKNKAAPAFLAQPYFIF